MANRNAVDFGDIQGLVRFAHGHLEAAKFLLLDVTEPKAAREWLRTAPVTTAATATPLPESALQIAFTASGLRALSVPETVIDEFSEEFKAGMVGDANRSRRLGDVRGDSPENWHWGGAREDLPHLLVMLYARDDGLPAWEEAVKGSGFAQAFRVRETLETAILGPTEPFGFVDGISQPRIDWQSDMSTDLHERDRYANLLVAGEVLLGHRNEYGLYTGRPLLDPQKDPAAGVLPVAEDAPALRDLGRNGTYLVVRQLGQDVPGFWRFLDAAAGSDAADRERLAAAMVGRERDGTPLAGVAKEPIPGIEEEAPGTTTNQFSFDDDPHGQRCPLGAHVRRANPRTGDFPVGVDGLISRLVRTLGFGQRHPHDDLIASTRFHRILRRGRSYGQRLTPEEALQPDAPEAERGLHFICLGANISRQFEFVQNAWMVSSKFAGLSSETDPLLGNRAALPSGQETDSFSLAQADGPARRIEGLPQFVAVRGGAYFFMPGIKALRYIAGHPSAL